MRSITQLVLLLLFSPLLLANDLNVFYGLDVSKLDSTQVTNKASVLLTLGLEKRLNKSHGVVLEFAAREAGQYDGIVLKGNLLYRHTIDRIVNTTAFISLGVSSIKIEENVCRIVTFSGGLGGIQRCNREITGKTGALFSIGAKFRISRKNSIIAKLSRSSSNARYEYTL